MLSESAPVRACVSQFACGFILLDLVRVASILPFSSRLLPDDTMSHCLRSIKKGFFLVAFLRDFWLARGSLDGLDDKDVLKFKCIVHPSSPVSAHEVSILVPVHLLADRVNAKHLTHLTLCHGVACKVKVLNDIYIQLLRNQRRSRM